MSRVADGETLDTMVSGEAERSTRTIEQSIARTRRDVSRKLGGVERSLMVLSAMLDGLEAAARPARRFGSRTRAKSTK